MKNKTALIARAMFATSAPMLLPEGDGPEYDIQWMPPGYQEPVCFVNGEPRQLKFTCQAKHAEIFNKMLQRLLNTAKAGGGDRPFTDYNHEDGAASSRPTKFYWGGEDPQTGGIRLVGKWTAKAREGIRDGEWDRFSPEWEFDPKTEDPIGLNVNLGGLVNRAAFKTIARVVAKDGSASTDNNIDNMTREEFQQLLADGLKPINEKIVALEAKAGSAQSAAASTAQAAAADDKITKLITDALKPVTDKLTAFETGQQNTLKAQAKAAVQVHVQRGAIAPEEKTPGGKLVVDFWADQYLANAADAEFAMAKLPGKTMRRVIINPTGSTTATAADAVDPEEKILAQARALREKNPTAYASDGAAVDALMKTAAGRELYEEFRDDVVAGVDRLPKQTLAAKAKGKK
jgi:hypothetical protein